MDKVIEFISANPWYVVGGLIIGVFLMRGSSAPPAGRRPGADLSATLASQQIASDTNVALAGIQVDRDSVAVAQNVAAIQAQRDIALGAQQVAIVNKTANTQLAVANVDNNATFAALNSDLINKTLTTLAGIRVARDDMSLQKYNLDLSHSIENKRLDVEQNLAMAGIGSNERITGAQIASDDRIATITLANDLAAALQGMQLDNQFANNKLFYDYRTTDRVMANLENLYWRQKQMNKSNNLFGFLNQNVQSIGSFAETAVSSSGGLW